MVSNPNPVHKLSSTLESWEKTKVVLNYKMVVSRYYAGFMVKIWLIDLVWSGLNQVELWLL